MRYNNDLSLFFDLKDYHKYINQYISECSEWKEYIQTLMSWRVSKMAYFTMNSLSVGKT